MQHIDPLLSNDREINKYTRTVAELTASQTNMFPRKKLNERCFLRVPCGGVIRGTKLRGLNLAVVKLTTIQVTKLPL
jgi:hypothetical protein